MAHTEAIAKQLCAALRAARLPTPCAAWTHAFLSSQPLPTPFSVPLSPSQLAPLLAAARTKILASDLTSAQFVDASTSAALPPAGSFAPGVAAATLPAAVVVQVLDIEDLARSRWDQVEELQAVERGEMTKGRQVIRTAPAEADETAPAAAAAGKLRSSQHATHRLVIQDFKGFQAFAMELSRIEALGVGRTTIGAKLLINAGAPIARGTILLEPANCAVLGGGVASWHSKWLEEKKKRLQDLVAPAPANGRRR